MSLPFKKDELSVSVACHRSVASVASDEFHRCLERWTVQATATDDDENHTYKVGSGRFYRLRVAECLDRGLSAWEVADSETSDTHELASALFDVEGNFHDHIEERYGDALALSHDVIFVDRASINKEYRGHHLGPIMVGAALNLLAPGACIAALEPAPTNDLKESDRSVWLPRIIRAWESIGFEQITDRVWALDVVTGPQWEQLLEN